MSDENPTPPNAKASPGTPTLEQALVGAIIGLLILLGIAWAVDWELSGFWRGLGYFLLEIISHLGK